MSSEDFSSFKEEDGGDPTDGIHTARLDAAVMLDTKNGKRIKLTWQTEDFAYWWESWHGVSGRSKGFTKDLLRALGVDLSKLESWDALGDELALFEGNVYEVAIERSGEWLNTTVLGKPEGQTELSVDTRGLPEAGAQAAAAATTGGGDDFEF